jgi:hypothetical protein
MTSSQMHKDRTILLLTPVGNQREIYLRGTNSTGINLDPNQSGDEGNPKHDFISPGFLRKLTQCLRKRFNFADLYQRNCSFF